MSNELTIYAQGKVAEATKLAATDPIEASRNLISIADTEGDQALTAAIASMDPVVLMTILKETAGKPSCILVECISPETFIKGLKEMVKSPNSYYTRLLFDDYFFGTLMQDGDISPNFSSFIEKIENSSFVTEIFAWWLKENDGKVIIATMESDEHGISIDHVTIMLHNLKESNPRLLDTIRQIMDRGIHYSDIQSRVTLLESAI